MAVSWFAVAIFIFAFVFSISAAEQNRVARCAVDGNVKQPLTRAMSPSLSESRPQLAGWTVRVPWSRVNPGEGVYFFNEIDDEVTYAGYADSYALEGVNIEITTGDDTPKWLLTSTSEGAQVSPFWATKYQEAYRDLMIRLAARYDSQNLIRGVFLSACTRNRWATESQLAEVGWTELAEQQCFHTAMFSHLSVWLNTPTILQANEQSKPMLTRFRIYFGPRLGVLHITQDLGQPKAKGLFKMVNNLPFKGALVVAYTGFLPTSESMRDYLRFAVDAHATTIVLPSDWNNVGQNFIDAGLLEEIKDKLDTVPDNCEYAPGRKYLQVTTASEPSYKFALLLAMSPDIQYSKQSVLGALSRLTGLPSSRFAVSSPIAVKNHLYITGFLYDAPFAVPASEVAKYIDGASRADWQEAGLDVTKANASKYNSPNDGLDGVTIFLIVLASVIYVVVFILFIYLAFVVVRYCVRDRPESTLHGWFRFKDEKITDPGFPSTTTSTAV